MSEIKKVKAVSMMPAINNLLKEGKGVRITVTGNSMYPFLRDKKDCVELYKTSFDRIKAGDIILVQRKEGGYVLHRVLLKLKKSVYILGDAQRRMEGPIYGNQILAKAEVIFRGDKKIAGDSLLIRKLSLLWTLVLPFRGIIMKSYRRLRNL
ncbi:S26 family signal peptidase [Anaerocolumna xylanovorans]|uniref:Peptidase S24-like n=1 Tax=Anaerocolumna xylanovorans DSM 12503 TaxID=1121345 RepID=A0A1M7YAB4_9FIRM|nr:S26 family signal peptidase [Anaerocolumna xylanovorans]SHO49574.1 hypothetical protein SAMN02745217_02392 [Anaerocolumna xylanovorans DSM 12503]